MSSDPLRTDPPNDPAGHDAPRTLDAASDADRDARIEQLLLAGLDHYFAAHYELAINVWTRALFFDRSHARARAYIERARSALAERQRQAEELLHGGAAAFRRGDAGEARRLLQAAIDGGAPLEDAFPMLERLNRMDPAPAAPPQTRAGSDRHAVPGPRAPHGAGRAGTGLAASLMMLVVLVAVGAYAAVASNGDWRAMLGLPSVRSAATLAPVDARRRARAAAARRDGADAGTQPGGRRRPARRAVRARRRARDGPAEARRRSAARRSPARAPASGSAAPPVKCSKCGYVGFESADRCRNCGYEFALAPAFALPDLPIRRDADSVEGLDDLALIDAGTARRATSGFDAEFGRAPEPRPAPVPSFSTRAVGVRAAAVRIAPRRRHAAHHPAFAAPCAALGPPIDARGAAAPVGGTRERSAPISRWIWIRRRPPRRGWCRPSVRSRPIGRRPTSAAPMPAPCGESARSRSTA